MFLFFSEYKKKKRNNKTLEEITNEGASQRWGGRFGE
jgi:hypothetical protein